MTQWRRWEPGTRSFFLRAVEDKLRTQLAQHFVYVNPAGIGSLEDHTRDVVLRVGLARRRLWGFGPVRSSRTIDLDISTLNEAILDATRRGDAEAKDINPGILLTSTLYWTPPDPAIVERVPNAIAAELARHGEAGA